MKEKIRVMLVEDHPEYREVVELALEREPDMELTGDFGTSERALRNLLDREGGVRPDVILLDLNLPGMSGLEATPLFIDVIPEAKIIILTQSDREEDVLKAITLGASGYLLKSSTVKEITEGIRSVAKGGASLDARIANFVLSSLKTQLPAQKNEFVLTDRELEVLVLLAEGLPKKSIADQLSISTNTVVTHVAHIYEKLNAQNAPAAIAKGFRMGILKVSSDE